MKTVLTLALVSVALAACSSMTQCMQPSPHEPATGIYVHGQNAVDSQDRISK